MSSPNPHLEGDSKLFKKKEDANGNDLLIVSPRALNIVWGNDRRYWKKIDETENIEDCVAELIQVSWLEVTGSVNLKPEMVQKKYSVGFTVSLTPDAFGWNNSPVYVMGKRGQKQVWKKFNLSHDAAGEKFEIPIPEKPLIVEPPPIEGSNTEKDEDKVYFGLYEVWSGRWKGGLKIHNAFLKEIPAGSKPSK